MISREETSIARGIGIAAVVFGHIHVPVPSLDAQTYHMALFFILGGVSMSEDRRLSETGWYLLRNFALFALALNAIYAVVAFAIEAIWKVDYQSSAVPLLQHLTTEIITGNGNGVRLALTNWFVVAYAEAYLCTWALVHGMRRASWGAAYLLLIAVVALWIGISLGGPKGQQANWMVNHLSHTLTGAGFMLVGFAAMKGGVLDRAMSSWWALLAASATAAYTVTALKPSGVVMAWSTYPAGPLPSILIALSMFLVIMWASRWLAATPLSWTLAYLGQRSKWIMAHHIAGFAIVNLALVSCGIVLPSKVGALTFWHREWLWPAYAVVAFGLPLVLERIWSRSGLSALRNRQAVPAR